MLKAYLVDCEQENGAQLYFAETANQAKCHAANEEGIDYIEVTSCHRKPEFDQYAPGPVPPKVLIEDGWWFECFGCYRRVDGDEAYDYDEDKELDGPVYRGNAVFCSTECQQSHDIKRAKEKRLDEQDIAATLVKWPKAEKVTPYMRGDHKRCVWFTFGGKNVARWAIGEDVVHVAQEDVEMWTEFANEENKEVPA